MKIYFKNKAARLKNSLNGYSCQKCPFFKVIPSCPFCTLTIVDCCNKGRWVDGESLEIFKL